MIKIMTYFKPFKSLTDKHVLTVVQVLNVLNLAHKTSHAVWATVLKNT